LPPDAVEGSRYLQRPGVSRRIYSAPAGSSRRSPAPAMWS